MRAQAVNIRKLEVLSPVIMSLRNLNQCRQSPKLSKISVVTSLWSLALILMLHYWRANFSIRLSQLSEPLDSIKIKDRLEQLAGRYQCSRGKERSAGNSQTERALSYGPFAESQMQVIKGILGAGRRLSGLASGYQTSCAPQAYGNV
jgi:hypothetical protein